MLIITSISVAAPSAKSIASWPTTLRTQSSPPCKSTATTAAAAAETHEENQLKSTTILTRRRRRRISAAAPSAENKGSPAKQQLISLDSLITTPDRTHPPIHPCNTSNPNNSCSTQLVVDDDDDDDEEEPLLHAPETQTQETPSTTLARPQTASQTDRRTD